MNLAGVRTYAALKVRLQRWGKTTHSFHKIPFPVNRANVKTAVVTLRTGDLPSVLKDMIHHVIREDSRSWDRQLPFLLFAYREVPNTTTGVSPFRLLYGREARGPLAILKSSWAGEIHLPTNISQSAADYLQEMKINMEKAAESASLTAAQKQKAYGDYFNKRSSVKNFSIGEQVVLLKPDSSNKIYARWTGPGEIIQHHPPHSYEVKLPDGTVRHVHVNKIRKYHSRALAVGVIFEGDHEFGEIHSTLIYRGPHLKDFYMKSI
ncbi:retrovirus-related Pol polyprotein from transposon 17.6 [Trichonephila clavipes]|nr:retrovirus-related Pol polyprotein from transposon 17.6 [Trichonephila clavipes]